MACAHAFDATVAREARVIAVDANVRREFAWRRRRRLRRLVLVFRSDEPLPEPTVDTLTAAVARYHATRAAFVRARRDLARLVAGYRARDEAHAASLNRFGKTSSTSVPR